jgi:hypothetical protein
MWSAWRRGDCLRSGRTSLTGGGGGGSDDGVAAMDLRSAPCSIAEVCCSNGGTRQGGGISATRSSASVKVGGAVCIRGKIRLIDGRWRRYVG